MFIPLSHPHTKKIAFGGEFSIFLTEEAYFKDSTVRRTSIWKGNFHFKNLLKTDIKD